MEAIDRTGTDLSQTGTFGNAPGGSSSAPGCWALPCAVASVEREQQGGGHRADGDRQRVPGVEDASGWLSPCYTTRLEDVARARQCPSACRART